MMEAIQYWLRAEQINVPQRKVSIRYDKAGFITLMIFNYLYIVFNWLFAIGLWIVLYSESFCNWFRVLKNSVSSIIMIFDWSNNASHKYKAWHNT